MRHIKPFNEAKKTPPDTKNIKAYLAARKNGRNGKLLFTFNVVDSYERDEETVVHKVTCHRWGTGRTTYKTFFEDRKGNITEHGKAFKLKLNYE